MNLVLLESTNVLQAAHVSCSSPDYATRCIQWYSSEHRREKLRGFATSYVAPYHRSGGGAAREALVMAITNSTVSLQEAVGDHMTKRTPYMTPLLSLRGFVAFGVLEHCLEKRNRVDVGLPLPGTRPKKRAISFRAADVPSERSEFSHPDVCIDIISGLTSDEVQNTFEMLLCLNIWEQDHKYNRWFESVKPCLVAEDQAALCDVRHISPVDTRQLELLCPVYSFCMETINFYLKIRVCSQKIRNSIRSD
ncbi:hypothetical protein PsorP6_010696 [Peronosclerospora sorghi]|uniref:Uncharacterized protein n=1 Tax=Peronosclerospora sorghi TaxID=230839 RepID=A0ACC0VXU3_9STRA|nr:hypothetical protein PsorP6_010696 [Peronosclerospora sorghi]